MRRNTNIFIAFLVAAVALLSACSGPRDSAVALELNATRVEIEIGGTYQLKAALERESGVKEPAEVDWSSGDESIATIDSNGTVEGIAAGETRLVATRATSGLSASATVVVSAQEPTEPTDPEDPEDPKDPHDPEDPTAPKIAVSLQPSSLTLLIGTSGELKATVSGAEDESVRWSVEPEAQTIVELTTNGNTAHLEALATGNVRVTATSVAEPSVKASATVEVVTVLVELDKDESELYVGEKLSVTATLSGPDGFDPGVTWSSSDPNVATVLEQGPTTIINALTVGTATITATSDHDPDSSASLRINVLSVPDFDPESVSVGGTPRLPGAPKGTPLNPFSSITEALQADLDAGAIIEVAPGDYEEDGPLVLDGQRLRGAGSSLTQITVTAPNCIGIRVTGDDTEISGITLDASGLDSKPPCDWVRGISSVNNSGLTVRDVVVLGAVDTGQTRNLAGISLYGATNALIENTEVRNTQRSGIEISGGSGIVLKDIKVQNAGQQKGAFAELPSLEGGYGAIGLFADDAAGDLEGVTLEGEFLVTGMAGRMAISVHAKDGNTVSVEPGSSFTWSSVDALSPIVINLSGSAAPDEQLEVSSTLGHLLNSVGADHLLKGEGPGSAEVMSGFTGQSGAVEVAKEILKETSGHVQPLILELGSPDSNRPIPVRNVLVIRTDDGRYEYSIEEAIATAAAMDATEGVLITPGVYTQQVSVNASITLAGTSKEHVVLEAPESLRPGSPATYTPLLEVSGDDVQATIQNLTLNAEFPNALSCMSNLEEAAAVGLAVVGGAKAEAIDVAVKNVGKSESKVCATVFGVLVGADAGNMKLGAGDLTADGLTVSMSHSGKAGITVSHSDSRLELRNSTLQASTTVKGNPAQNGLHAIHGDIVINDVTIDGFAYDSKGEDRWTAAGILLFTPGDVEINDLTIKNTDAGIYFGGNEVDIDNVAFEDIRWWYLQAGSDVYHDFSGKTISFDGEVPTPASSLDDLFAIEKKIDHAIDNDALKGRVRLVDSAWYVTEGANIATAVTLSREGDTVYLQNGNHAMDAVTLSLDGLSIVGMGSDKTVLQATSDDQTGFTVNAPNTTIRDLALEGYRTGIILQNAEGGTLEGLAISEGVFGIYSPHNHKLDGLTFASSALTDLSQGFVIETDKSNESPSKGITIDRISVQDVQHKGFYIEDFDNSSISNVTIEGTGNEHSFEGGVAPAGVALEINLKYKRYGTVTLNGITIANSGWSNASNSYGNDHEPTHENAAALAIAVRNDGGYESDPAALGSLLLEDVNITGAYTALRLGEHRDSRFTTGASETRLIGVELTGQKYAIRNLTTTDVDATNADNEFTGGIQDKNTDSPLGEVKLAE